jgi:hypothetical protein
VKNASASFRKVGNSPAAIACLPAVAASLEGRWSAEDFSIGDAVRVCCPGHIAVAVMEAIRARTHPLTVNAWEHVADRTEDNVIALLEARSDQE